MTNTETHSSYTPNDALWATWVLEAACDDADCRTCIACFNSMQKTWTSLKSRSRTARYNSSEGITITQGLWYWSQELEKCGQALVAEFGGKFE